MLESQIDNILTELRELENLFEPSTDASGTSLSGQNRAKFKRLVLEAKAIVDAAIGISDFGVPLLMMQNLSSYGAFSPPSLNQLHEAIGLVEGARNQMRRSQAEPMHRQGTAQLPAYVDPKRVLELQGIVSSQWDLKRLVRLLQEVNLSHVHEMHMATAILVRATVDHVAPVLGCKNFSEIANNYTAPRSFSDQMKHLDVSLRKVADSYLHQQIRKAEVLPLAPQVDFRAALDVLLAEIVRMLR